MSQDDWIETREEVVGFLNAQLIGPADGDDEIVVGTPLKRYAAGMLFPQGTEAGRVIADEEEDDQANASADEEALESPISMAFQRLPASMGVSFVLRDGEALRCETWAARYEKVEEESEEGTNKAQRRWRRVPLASRESPTAVVLEPEGDTSGSKVIFDGRARIDAIWRPIQHGRLVTVTLLNARSVTAGGSVDPADCLFQVGFRCVPSDSGRIAAYPRITRLTHDDEDEELALVYRRQQTFAVGHGCAAAWLADEAGESASWVEAAIMPVQEVKGMTAEHDSGDLPRDALRLQWLMDESVERSVLRRTLDEFVDEYASWISGLRTETLPAGFERARGRILDRLDDALARMRRGVETLCDPDRPLILEAFRLAMRAMLMQMVHSSPQRAGTLRERGAGLVERPDYASPAFAEFGWYPFQLAFQLLVINSLVNDREEDQLERALVDLIWFPTGGGKTEAYLALSAFEILHRRLRHGDAGGGTVVITRYTLRLLTSQQFERTATLIVALESMRAANPRRFGEEPITLGLWVGGTTTPNHLTGGSAGRSAEDLYNEMLSEDRPSNPFQLQKCPWCGTRLVPAVRSADPSDYGVFASPDEFRFYCPDERCECHASIPVSIVDEDLYRNVPTIVVGTIDKFARMAWEPRSRKFLGIDQEGRLPPSLIIQDELHLISGPLGTIAGVYESAIDTIIASQGRPAKIIAATATIRRATEQTRLLYARDVRVFPPPGLDAGDSYFARLNERAPGRLYVGAMAQGHTRMFALVQVAAALTQAPAALTLAGEELDAYWTQVIYHNSRRELGKTMTLARDDVPSRVEILEPDPSRRRRIAVVEELSANVKGARIGEVLENLATDVSSGAAVDVLACTNMISVGVDVSRLSLMLVYGQPKTTSEYIQASSRVGRSAKRPPGIVVTLYAPTKPRDRSHYESFKSYHQALYRFVEPSSVTPYAPPARDRTLHAALVIVMRHVAGLITNDSAAAFDSAEARTQQIIEQLLARMQAADQDESGAIRSDLEALVAEWREEASRGGPALRFAFPGGRNFRCLLRSFDEGDRGLWKTLNSMRHVDQESLVAVRGGWT